MRMMREGRVPARGGEVREIWSVPGLSPTVHVVAVAVTEMSFAGMTCVYCTQLYIHHYTLSNSRSARCDEFCDRVWKAINSYMEMDVVALKVKVTSYCNSKRRTEDGEEHELPYLGLIAFFCSFYDECREKKHEARALGEELLQGISCSTREKKKEKKKFKRTKHPKVSVCVCRRRSISPLQ